MANKKEEHIYAYINLYNYICFYYVFNSKLYYYQSFKIGFKKEEFCIMWDEFERIQEEIGKKRIDLPNVSVSSAKRGRAVAEGIMPN